ncbi:MAG TPA: EAL domain-containing protein [Acidimicrobiales bacterium]|nr:EAL domain-containing protein [Acidimicrobiales bacterium]
MAPQELRSRKRPGAPNRRRRPPAQARVYALVSALAVGLLALDHRRGTDVTVLALVALVAPVSIVVGLRRHRPASSIPWLVLALGAGLLAGGGAVRTAHSAWGALPAGADHLRLPAEHAVFVPGALLLVLGAALLVCSPRRRDRRNVDNLIEATLAGTVAFSIGWAFWAGADVGRASGAPWLGRLGLALTFPLAVSFAALVCAGFSRPPWRMAAGRRLLIGAAGLAAFVVLVQLTGTGRLALAPAWLEAGLALVVLAIAGAALHPTMRQLSRPGRPSVAGAPPRVRVAITMAAAVVPIVIVLARPEPATGRPVALSVAAIVTVVLGAWRAARALKLRSGTDDRLAHAVTHDPLTGLANRARLCDWLGEALQYARPDSTLGVILLDIDRFKLVNDTHGYAHGDLLLIEVARRLEAGAGDRALVARLGGDEFVVALTDGAGGTVGVRRAAERLLARLEAPYSLYATEVLATASVGVALASPGDPMSDPESLIRDADTAMYQAKAAGRDTITFFDASMRDRIADRLALEHDLRLAIERDEFRLFFQPIVSIGAGTSAVVGLEALLRWDRPTRGLVPPSLFVAVAEESGLIVEIGEWVVREACRQLAGWRRTPAGEGLFVSVNVSALQLKNASLLSKLRGALSDGGLEPGSLCIELAESVLTANPAEGAAFLVRLKELGVKVAIDDFGTGYSSLAYLKQFPVDYVKIDHSFVAGLAVPDTTDETLVAAVVAMAQSLDVITIAEGVEDELQDQTLRELDVELAQGFLYSRPVPAERVLDAVSALSPRHGLRLVTGDGGGGPPGR